MNENDGQFSFLNETQEGIILSVRLQPRASKNEISGTTGDSLKVKVTAPPVESAANEALCRFFSQVFNIAKGRISIISGLHSRQKKVLLQGIDKEFITGQTAQLLQSKGRHI